ncbi:PREDICTED: voltage-dependent calcium channel subunit alpha-2/delta-2-like [Rhagoletis zephyria]|uniref:voltage-dependent calcium channel subunit alpha-2/delta-2-like n=1 Tax=Rhagoletis zephyria TaxID=28612 RepID=UPI000811625B|nr:PREDICTED: voltage-dependent calcium channel subunit alpha-2/delta-2-like [Rhagoletis zephyria]
MVRTFGRELSSAATEQTCLGRIEENFQAYSGEVSYFDGNKMMDDMRQDVINMLNWKRHAVDRIANESERISSNHTFDKNLDNFPFLNVNQPPIDSEDDGGGGGGGGGDGDDKKDEPIGIKPEGLRPSTAAANFDGYEVDLESSAVHIPVNVFHKAVEVINDIKWSDALTPFFKNNLAFDPSLSWQFFGSAKGFLRLYPAFQWREPPNLKVGAEAVGEDGSLQPPPSVDFYDCRMRSWYIQGAASPKDIVLLLDTSGSMLGRRRILASDVVSKILDTLTEDDYVAAYQFNKNVTPICGCLDRLVRATKRNVLTIKGALPGLKSENPVNFTGALLEAFSTLQAVNKSGRGSQCNQAIMIVTDGAPSTYEEIFRQFNYPNIPVRVFTYQVGKDVTMNGEMYWMACENRGYFTHVANRAEVHEQVQKYIPVLSRPVVLSGQRIFSWTPVYAPNSKMELTDWNWDNKQKSEFVANLRANGALGLVSGDQSSVSLAEETAPESSATAESSDLLESRHSTQKHNITRRVLIKNVYQDKDPEQIHIANLLGVAGIDVPIKEIIKLTPPFKLGVNGYVFIISNNGYILYHPDLRPCFEDFLKPFYASVDLGEVELANNTNGPRDWSGSEIEVIRNNMIERTHGWKKVAVKMHIDEMRRVVTRVNHYTHGWISNTPFSLAIALPEPYGSYRLTSAVDLKMKFRSENFTAYFRGDKDLVQKLVLDAKLTDIPSTKCNTSPNLRE